jgi:putative membrane-bound dehydrogenase-like protein
MNRDFRRACGLQGVDGPSAGVRCLLVATLALAVWATAARADQPVDYAAQLPRIPATEPSAALAAFTVAPGFRLEQVAAEPLVTSPVACEWDENGRLFVCEMRGYGEHRDDGLSRITVLDDDDGDGRYDRRSVFAEGLLWPTAVFPYDGGLFVVDAPELLFLRDTDGDGRADHRQVVLTGFGTANVQGLPNCFRWGLDNRLHLATGNNGGRIAHVGGPAGPVAGPAASAPVDIGGRDLAIDPRTGAFRLTSGALQHGMSFDDWGRKFVSGNSNHIQQVMYEDRYVARNPFLKPPAARIDIAADGPQAEVFRTSPVEPWREIRTQLRVAGKVPGPVEGGGRAAGYFTGATGVTIYRGDSWPAEWRGIAVVGDAGGNLVHRKRLEPEGLRFIARRIDPDSEFVTSSDNWFRPVQFANSPDGSLHLLDMCREVIEHPRSIPPELKRHLDLASGRDRGRIYRILPTAFRQRPTPRLAAATTPELVALLEHPNAWHRETAARLLFIRQDPAAAAPLAKLAAGSAAPVGRLHALRALEGLGALEEAHVLAALADPEPGVRRHAVQLSEAFAGSSTVVEQLVALVDDPAVEVRYQLAFTLGERAGMPEASVPAVRDALVRIAARDGDDPWMQVAIQSSLAGEAAAMLGALVEGRVAGRIPPRPELVESLAAEVAARDGEADIRGVVALFGKLPEADAATALALTRGLAGGLGRADGVLPRMRAAGELEAMDAIVSQLLAKAIATATDSSADTAGRVAAIEGLRMGGFADVGPTLERLLDPREPREVQAAAIDVLGRLTDPAAADVLIAAWSTFAPRPKEAAIEALCSRSTSTLRLFEAVAAGRVPAGDLPSARLGLLAKARNMDVATAAQKLLAASGTRLRQSVIDSYRDCLEMPGDVERGRSAFRSACASCHRVEGTGHEIGPNLAAMKTRGAEAILVNVLDPNREVNPSYVNYVCLTDDGRAVTGMLAAETAGSVTLRRAEGAEDTVLRSDIDELQSTGQSVMPEGLEKQLDRQSMADLIAYLMQVP